MNKRVLIVEDDDLIRTTFVRLLRIEGYEALTASNGREALEILKNNLDNLPSLVLTDFMMPEMDGQELIWRLKQDDVLLNLPIVMLSAWEKPDLPPGVIYLKKPIEIKALIEHVRRFCGPPGQGTCRVAQ